MSRRTLAIALVASALLLSPQPSTADSTTVRFSVAQDYPASTVTYNGTESPGAVAHLFRNGKADTNADLVMGNLGGGPVLLYGVGRGRFTPQRTVLDNSDTDASAIQVADFNADGVPDIVSGGYTTTKVTVMLGHRDGTFAVSGQYPLQGVWVSTFGIADFNRDHHLDIAVASYGGGRITILLGKGDGTFRAPLAVPGPNVALALLVDDFDQDGIADLAVTESQPSVRTPSPLGTASGRLVGGSVNILLGKGDGTFRQSGSYPVGTISELIRYGDIDEDGHKDLFVFNDVGLSNDASIFFGLGKGRFGPEQPMRLSGPSSVQVLDEHATESGEGLQLLDLNGDGHLDMAVTQIISSRLVLFQGDGRGHFASVATEDVAGFPEDILAGDLDGDGCTDLAVPGNVPPIGPADVAVARVSVLLNLTFPGGCRTPSPVRGLRATGGLGSMTVSWQPPSTHAAAVTSYSVLIQGIGRRSVPSDVHHLVLRDLPRDSSGYRVSVNALGAPGFTSQPVWIAVERGRPSLTVQRTGTELTFKGSLGTSFGPMAGAKVTVQRRSGDSWIDMGTAATKGNGAYVLSVDGAHGTASYRAVFLGSPGIVGSASEVLRR